MCSSDLDILRHLINVYGLTDLTGRDTDGKLFFMRSGVVLIDEIDAHLHPEWQREIGFWLKRHFPNIQFIVTTHSPIICQAADVLVQRELESRGQGVREHRAAPCRLSRGLRPRRFIA